MPSGFNQFALPLLPEGLDVTWSKLLVHALPITFLTYMESISVGQKFATLNRYALDMTQELWALGLGCVAASFFQAYPPGGSFSRTVSHNLVTHTLRCNHDTDRPSWQSPQVSPPSCCWP